MTHELYLAASCTQYQIIEDTENRFPKYVQTIRALMGDFGLDVLFIRSNACKSEIRLDGDPCVIIDRQTDLYMNALTFPEIFHKDSDEFEYHLLHAYSFIVASELRFLGYSNASDAFLEKFPEQTNFNQPVDIFAEMSRLHFTVFHEDGHNYLAKSPDERAAVFKMIDAQFVELFGELSFLDPRVQALTDDLKEECAVDYYALVLAFRCFADDPMASAAIGGLANFSYSALVNIHQLAMFRRLKHYLDCAVEGREIDKPKVDPITIRLRLTRQLFNRLNEEHLGTDVALSIHNRFTDYLGRNHQQLSDTFPNRLLMQIPDLISGETAVEVDPFSGRFAWS